MTIAGDLNFTLSENEIRGHKAKQDPLCFDFSDLFDRVEMVDVEPLLICPTWINGRLSDNGIAKRLDRFLLGVSLIDKLDKYMTWADFNNFLDHYRIICQFEAHDNIVKIPFKFNYGWLKEKGFKELVKHVWTSSLELDFFTPMELLTKKLKMLKDDVIKWEKEKNFFLQKRIFVTVRNK